MVDALEEPVGAFNKLLQRALIPFVKPCLRIIRPRVEVVAVVACGRQFRTVEVDIAQCALRSLLFERMTKRAS